METPDRKSQTTRISLADVIAAKSKGVSQPPPTTRTKFPGSKRSTTRIMLIEDDEDTSLLKTAAKAETEAIPAIPVQQPVSKAPPTARFRKPSTTQITGFATTTVAKKKGDTTAATVARQPVAGGTVSKSSTSRILLKEDVSSAEKKEDLSSINSPIMGIPVEPEVPKTTAHHGVPVTIKLKRPVPPPSSPVASEAGAGAIPRTIRIAKQQQPAVSAEAPTVVKKVTEPPSRGETARLSIENADILKKEVLSTASTVVAQKPPRTIKLKRPSDIADLPEAPPSSEEEQIAIAKKSETAKIQLPEIEGIAGASQPPLTQRKTIKIKRTDRSGQMRTISLKRPQEEELSEQQGAEAAVSGEEFKKMEVGVVWSIFALAAVFCVIGLLYILASQALGPTPTFPVPFEY